VALTPEQMQAIYKAVKEGRLSGRLPKRLQEQSLLNQKEDDTSATASPSPAKASAETAK